MAAQLAKVGLVLLSLAYCLAHIEPLTTKSVQQWLYLACNEGKVTLDLYILRLELHALLGSHTQTKVIGHG